MIRNNKIKNRRMVILLLILGLTLGFASLVTTLKINGFTLIKKNIWDIRWDRDSIVLSEDMPSGTALPTPSTSSTTDDTISFNANLGVPGDYYEFYVDAINNGTINGEISSITTTWKKNGETVSLPDFLEYTIIYADTEIAPVQGDMLYAGQSRTYRIRLEYKNDATTVLNENEQYIGTIAITYNQGPDGAAPSGGDAGPGARKIADITEETDDQTPVNPIPRRKPAMPGEDNPIPTETTSEPVFVGDEPNNFIYFNCDSLDNQNADNCELWRIIGTDKDVGNRIKIIRDESIGEFAWNTNTTGVTNNWETSTLKEYLNTTYYDSLTEVSKKLIPEVTWYNVGGTGILRNSKSHDDGETYWPLSSRVTYLSERTKFKTTDSSLKRNNVKAKVGLMYASDYGYASSVCSSDCVATGEYPCRYAKTTGDRIVEYDAIDDYGASTCKESNWMYTQLEEWTMTADIDDDPYARLNWPETYYENVTQEVLYVVGYHVSSYNGQEYGGNVGNTITWYEDRYHNIIFEEKNVRPVVYLKSGVDLEGEGSRNSPYRIIASNDVLNNDDVLPCDIEQDEPDEPVNDENVISSHVESGCSDTTPPTCEVNHVTVLSNGFDFAFNCTDDVEINRITSLFDSDPFSGKYDSRTFNTIGTIKNGTVLNGGKTKSHAGRWTTSAKTNPPNKRTCYYFSYGGEDKCGNWVVYHTPNCFQFGQ